MPPNYITLHCLLFSAMLSWTSAVVQGDRARYGMRIKPLNRAGLQTTEHCPSCQNNTLNPNTKSDSNLPNSIQKTNKPTNRVGEVSNTPTEKVKLTVNPLVKIQQTSSPIYSEFPSHNASRGATFFFTQLEPHRFEYRAMFQHHRNNFQPFVHNFQPFSHEYPPLPKFPSFPEFGEFFPNQNDPFAKLPEFTFPTLSPEIKRVWNQVPEVKPPPKPILPDLPEIFDNPLLKNYDIVLGHAKYPKIFRFNEERMNIEDFDRQKKITYYNLAKSGQNDLVEPENVKRDHLLILHGGIFTVKEPPLFNKHFKKRRKLGSFGHHTANF